MARDKDGLSPRQKAWCDEYIKTGNGIEAARRAGYRNAKKSSENNRDNHACRAYIAARTTATTEKRIADADEVLLYLSAVMRGEVKDQFGLDASLQDRTKAAQELMKRYAVADMRQQSTMQRLDSIFLEFRAALDAPTVTIQPATPAQLPADGAEDATPTAPATAPQEADTAGGEHQGDGSTPA